MQKEITYLEARQDKELVQNLLREVQTCGSGNQNWREVECEEAGHTMQQLAHAKVLARDVGPECCAVSFAASLVEPARNTTWC